MYSSYREGDSDSKVRHRPFVLDEEAAKGASEFLIEFVAVDGVRHIFSFGTTPDAILYEELTAYYSKQPSLLYKRWVEDGKQQIKFGTAFTGPKKPIWNVTRPNALFLSAAAAGGSSVIAPAYYELTMRLGYYDAAHYIYELENIKLLAREDEKAIDELSRLISFADVGVDEIRVMRGKRRTIYEDDEALVDLQCQLGSAAVSGRDRSDGQDWLASTDVYFHHRGNSGAWLSSAMESDGTLAALAFFSVALRSLKKGSVVLVDEIDRSLHPTLCRELVSLFTDPETNPKQAQLVFTTHDTALISSTSAQEPVLNRYQIWFTEKQADGASELIPLTDYSPRSRENIGRNYLNGVYYAIPEPRFHGQFADIMSAAADREV